jgi:uncharacterized membrane protein YvlD (DUF360 family)
LYAIVLNTVILCVVGVLTGDLYFDHMWNAFLVAVVIACCQRCSTCRTRKRPSLKSDDDGLA